MDGPLAPNLPLTAPPAAGGVRCRADITGFQFLLRAATNTDPVAATAIPVTTAAIVASVTAGATGTTPVAATAALCTAAATTASITVAATAALAIDAATAASVAATAFHVTAASTAAPVATTSAPVTAIGAPVTSTATTASATVGATTNIRPYLFENGSALELKELSGE